MRIDAVLTGLAVAVALTAGAVAAPNLDASIRMCADKADATQRLACYDAIAAAVKASAAVAAPAPAPVSAPAAVPAPAVAAVTPAAPAVAAAPRVAPEAAFGSENLPKEIRKTVEPEQAEAIHSVLKSFGFAPNGRVVVTLENGQVWRQIDGDITQFRGKAGETVTIERAIFGSYSMTTGDRVALFKVRRIK